LASVGGFATEGRGAAERGGGRKAISFEYMGRKEAHATKLREGRQTPDTGARGAICSKPDGEVEKEVAGNAGR